MTSNRLYASFTTSIRRQTCSSGATGYVGTPNITGRFGRIQTRYIGTSVIEGAFYKDSPTNDSFSGGSNWEVTYLGIDASRSSSMYGSAKSVQPSSLLLLPCIKF